MQISQGLVAAVAASTLKRLSMFLSLSLSLCLYLSLCLFISLTTGDKGFLLAMQPQGEIKEKRKRCNCVLYEFWLLLARLLKDQRPSLPAEICQIFIWPALECDGWDFHPFSILLDFLFPTAGLLFYPGGLKKSICLHMPHQVVEIIRKMWESDCDKKSHFKK